VCPRRRLVVSSTVGSRLSLISVAPIARPVTPTIRRPRPTPSATRRLRESRYGGEPGSGGATGASSGTELLNSRRIDGGDAGRYRHLRTRTAASLLCGTGSVFADHARWFVSARNGLGFWGAACPLLKVGGGGIMHWGWVGFVFWRFS
jgi:hypothetical protein